MRTRTTTRLTVILVLALAGSALAYTSIGNNWKSTYPDACQTLVNAANNCTLCHGNNDSRNAYALQYKANGSSWLAIENLDADNDGRTNIQEINECTLPGNAASHVANDVDTWSTVKALYR